MTIGIVGVKRGMTRIFTEDGVSIPVTVIEATPNRVVQRKTADTDGYNAIQVTFGDVKASKVNKAKAGHFSKANVDAGRKLCEFRCDAEEALIVGDALTVERFVVGQKMRLTETLYLTVRRDLLASVKARVGYLKARKWQAIWVPLE
jgi:large subunit ribosomal protein L3